MIASRMGGIRGERKLIRNELSTQLLCIVQMTPDQEIDY